MQYLGIPNKLPHELENKRWVDSSIIGGQKRKAKCVGIYRLALSKPTFCILNICFKRGIIPATPSFNRSAQNMTNKHEFPHMYLSLKAFRTCLLSRVGATSAGSFKARRLQTLPSPSNGSMNLRSPSCTNQHPRYNLTHLLFSFNLSA